MKTFNLSTPDGIEAPNAVAIISNIRISPKQPKTVTVEKDLADGGKTTVQEIQPQEGFVGSVAFSVYKNQEFLDNNKPLPVRESRPLDWDGVENLVELCYSLL